MNFVDSIAIEFFAWTILLLICNGFGKLFASLFGIKSSGLQSWFAATWIGVALIIGILQIWHIFLPIDWRVSLLLVVAGIVCQIIFSVSAYRKNSQNHLSRCESSLSKNSAFIRVSYNRFYRPTRVLLVAIIILLIAGYVFILASGQTTNYDDGLYHFTSIRWANEYPIVPGLVNLHNRLAFNQAWMLFIAALNVYPYFNLGHHIGAGFLMFLLMTQTVFSAVYLLRFPKTASPFYMFQVIILCWIIYYPWVIDVPSASADLAAVVLGLVLSSAFVHFLFSSETADQRYVVSVIIVVSIVLITIKLSTLILAAFTILLTCVVLLVRHRQYLFNALRPLVVELTCVGMFFLIPWMVRGVILSGYVAYPIPIGSVPVDWKISTSAVNSMVSLIYSWARQPEVDPQIVLADWSWIHWWIDNIVTGNTINVVLPLLVALGGLTLFALLSYFIRHKYLGLGLPFIPVIVSLIYWFLTAPTPRFAGSNFLVIGSWALTLPVVLLHTYKKRLTIYIFFGLVLLLTTIHLVDKVSYEFRDTSILGFTLIPSVSMEIKTTNSGLSIFVPQSGDQGWNSPLPNTPYFNSDLELRTGDIKDGFRLQNPQ